MLYKIFFKKKNKMDYPKKYFLSPQGRYTKQIIFNGNKIYVYDQVSHSKREKSNSQQMENFENTH